MLSRSRHVVTSRRGLPAIQSQLNVSLIGKTQWQSIRLSSSTVTVDQRARLSKLWAPSGGIAPAADEDAHAKLIRAGYLRQAYSGIFHMLPLGLRVQDKVQKLIDKHMFSVGSSRLDLSSISSQELWATTGRLNAINAELFRLKDRKESEYLLAPTHEEEITSLVANTAKSYKDFPIRLHQISRKYRDELRPRHGLLRGREFLMKDLYSFDINTKAALETYEQVKAAYVNLFDELKIPYLVAEADSGDIGGDLSHEFHFPIPQGEDHIISCGSCSYVANEELAESALRPQKEDTASWKFMSQDEQSEGENIYTVWRGISRDRSTLINAWHPKRSQTGLEVNTHAVKSVVSDLDPGIENAALMWARSLEAAAAAGETPAPKIVNLIDHRLPKEVAESIQSGKADPMWSATGLPAELGISVSTATGSDDGKPLNLMRIADGDSCSRCDTGTLKVQKAIELGHTFYLGTRYSEPLKAMVTLPASLSDKPAPDNSKAEVQVPLQMGCYGIGVTRLIGAIAETLADEKGLNWPCVIAPYEAVIVPTKGMDEDAVHVYDELAPSVDAVVDDRAKGFPWKMNDADLVGYPIIVVVGRGWKESKTCEVQCRRLGIKENVPLGKLKTFVQDLRASL